MTSQLTAHNVITKHNVIIRAEIEQAYRNIETLTIVTCYSQLAVAAAMERRHCSLLQAIQK